MIRSSIYLLLVALMLAGCQGSGVTTDYNPGADFVNYQRYQWQEKTSGADKHVGPLIADRVREALQRQLDTGLYRHASDDEPDFLVRYYARETAQTEESRARGSIGLGSMSGNIGLGVGVGFPLGGTRVTREVEIVIDVIDAETEKLAWRGVKRFELIDDSPKEITEKVDRVVKDIWSEYPPR